MAFFIVLFSAMAAMSSTEGKGPSLYGFRPVAPTVAIVLGELHVVRCRSTILIPRANQLTSGLYLRANQRTCFKPGEYMCFGVVHQNSLSHRQFTP
jgi:hypothetical protein